MCLSNSNEPHVELAIDVFKTRSRALVLSLKDFLTVLPNPKCVEDVLTAAIYQLAETDPDACRWVLRNARYLEPEVDLGEVARTLASTKLENHGFLPGQDFQFESDSRLQISETAKARLMVANSTCERLILEELLEIGH